MKSVFIDESGYTGYDLLNQEQPFQAASAVYISDHDASELIGKHFPNLRSNELKYSRLARRENHWENLLALQKELLTKFDCVSYICNKKYLLILHFLNYATEPFYHEKGTNFYEAGSLYNLASALYYEGHAILTGHKFRKILELFQYAMKSKSEISVIGLIEEIKSSPWRKLPEVFGPLAEENNACKKSITSEETSTDGALVALLSIITRLEDLLDHSYDIIHDRSKNLEQYDKFLQEIIKHQNNTCFRLSQLTKLKFPLKLVSITQVDSKKSSGVQLADILVGGIIDGSKAITGRKTNEYNNIIYKLYKDNQLIHLLPNSNISENNNFRRGSQSNEMINYFEEHFS
ncbi:DUF3800 domain-containing protein [Microbulbifer sp. JMSA003]|uniref:DUF3800 domain-containing protein n=1 Tax=Microbulbifer sp. JMSA003 TaxID=3243369 RepID=UPI004039A09E